MEPREAWLDIEVLVAGEGTLHVAIPGYSLDPSSVQLTEEYAWVQVQGYSGSEPSSAAVDLQLSVQDWSLRNRQGA